MSAVASGLLASDMEKELEENINSKKIKRDQDDNPAEPVAQRMTKTTTIKKVRLTPSKILSMVVGDGGKKKSTATETEENPVQVVGKKKKYKTDVKEAIFGPGDVQKRLKQRGSSSEDEGALKEKKPKRLRRRRRKEASPIPPPLPKEPTPQPPVEQPALDEEEIQIPEESPKEPTPQPPPVEEPAPEEEQPKEETLPELSSPASEPPTSPTVAQTDIEAASDGLPTDDEEEIFPRYQSPTDRDKSKTNFGSLCCPVAEKYTCSSFGRLRWILLLIYRGPLCYTGQRILKTAPLPDLILGPTFDSVLLEYFSLMLDGLDELLTRLYPDLDRVADLMQQIEKEEDE